MANPFSYSKDRHRREETPPVYKDYKSYKKYLRREFKGQCVYCRMPDALLGKPQFGTDHYRPQSLFPELAADYSNLFYCCNTCNSHKGNYWPSDDSSPHFIANPVAHSMYAHLRYKNATVESASQSGQFTLEYLDLNDPAVVRYREDLIHMIDLAEEKIKELAKAEIAVKSALAAGRITDEVFQEKMAKIREIRFKTNSALDRASGRYMADPE